MARINILKELLGRARGRLDVYDKCGSDCHVRHRFNREPGYRVGITKCLIKEIDDVLASMEDDGP